MKFAQLFNALLVCSAANAQAIIAAVTAEAVAAELGEAGLTSLVAETRILQGARGLDGIFLESATLSLRDGTEVFLETETGEAFLEAINWIEEGGRHVAVAFRIVMNPIETIAEIPGARWLLPPHNTVVNSAKIGMDVVYSLLPRPEAAVQVGFDLTGGGGTFLNTVVAGVTRIALS